MHVTFHKSFKFYLPYYVIIYREWKVTFFIIAGFVNVTTHASTSVS